MARPRIHEYWIDKIRTLVANKPKLSAAAIHRELKNYSDQGPKPMPSERTVGAIKQRLTNEDLKNYRYFTWPDSMGAGELPWEASRVALDLMRFRHEEQMEPPVFREVLWFWRVTLAAPEEKVDERDRLARELAMEEKDELSPGLSEERLTSIRWRLVYQPLAKNKKEWMKLPEELRSPLFHSTPAKVRSAFRNLDVGKRKKKKRKP